MRTSLIHRFLPLVIIVLLSYQCELSETCANCVDPDFTVFVFDTTANGFKPHEIDSFYIIKFTGDQLSTPLDTTELFIRQNPFFINRNLFGTSTLGSNYVVESPNQEFKFEITDLDYTIRTIDDNCRCDIVENKSLSVNGALFSLPDSFQTVLLQK